MRLSICCSPGAVAIAERLSARLRQNLEIDTLVVAEDEVPVSETWEEGAAAQAVLILMDAVSAPPPFRREAWNGIIEHNGEPSLAFVRLEECAYPKLLERRRFLPAEAPELDRAVESWLAGLLPAHPGIAPAICEAAFSEEWWETLADRPGQAVTEDAAAAHAFARQARGQFQGVVWIGCAGREPAVIKAELEHRAGDARLLVVLSHVAKPLNIPPSRHSLLQIQAPAPHSGPCYAPGFPGWLARDLNIDLSFAVPLDEQGGLYRAIAPFPVDDELRARHLTLIDRYFASWKKKPAPCRDLLPEVSAALDYGFTADWPRARQLCRRAAELYRADARRRECARLYHRLQIEALEHGDDETAADAAHQLSWLTDEDLPAQPQTVAADQLSLF